MNKTNKIAKTLIVGLACAAFCGTTLAAPHCGNGGRAPRRAPAHHTAPAPRGGHAPHGAPVVHRTPPPPPPHCHGGHNEAAGWVALGAAAIGGLVGGIVGACR